jgi:hypothetical protein
LIGHLLAVIEQLKAHHDAQGIFSLQLLGVAAQQSSAR